MVIITGFIGSLRSPWKSLNFWKNSRPLKVLENRVGPWKSLKVLEKSLNLNVPYFEIFAYQNFEESILVKFGISPILGYSSLAYLKNFPVCITYNLFVYIFQNSFKCYVIVVTARVWYVFLSILLVLENWNFRSLRSPWKVLEFCPFSLLWTLLSAVKLCDCNWLSSCI